MEIRFLNQINKVDADSWNALWNTDYPFIQHSFLVALEESKAVCAESGWSPQHLIITQNNRLLAAMPLYLKTHSYGEYVFDWAWADAYHQHGREYYPKLVNAIPFTPSTGPRIALCRNLAEKDRTLALNKLSSALMAYMNEHKCSSWHLLFPDQATQKQLNTTEFANTLCQKTRLGCQFHWFNQDYSNFENFLDGFNARKRKSLKRERRKVSEQNIRVIMKPGEEISEIEWQHFYRLYHRTYLKRSGRTGYLNLPFFKHIAMAMPQHILMAQAYQNNELVAVALYFRDSTTLYGRYWGSSIDADGLHFECCYYQGIEYAIQQQLKRFDPGAQGEHKIQRGFTPVLTCSYHLINDAQFRQAVERFLQEEEQHIINYAKSAQSYLPFKTEIAYPAMDSLLNPIGKC